MSAAGLKSTPGALSQVVAQARRLLPLPDQARLIVAGGGLEVADHPALMRWLGSDPALCELLLLWVNSPLFNLGRPIESLQQAVALLGGRDLARLATIALVRRLFIPEQRIELYSRARLWRHSLAVAAVAALIARSCHKAEPGEAFFAGALHDIGLLACERLTPDAFAQTLRELDALTETPLAERRLRGWDHQQLGGELLEGWGLGGAASAAAKHHHQPAALAGAPHWSLVACVAVANYLCSRTGWNALGVHNTAPPPDPVFARLGIDARLLSMLWQQLPATLEAVGQLR